MSIALMDSLSNDIEEWRWEFNLAYDHNEQGDLEYVVSELSKIVDKYDTTSESLEYLIYDKDRGYFNTATGWVTDQSIATHFSDKDKEKFESILPNVTWLLL